MFMSCGFYNKASFILNVILAGTVIVLVMHEPASRPLPPASRSNPKIAVSATPPAASGPKTQPRANNATGADWQQWVD
jgi:hypothetical protein